MSRTAQPSRSATGRRALAAVLLVLFLAAPATAARLTVKQKKQRAAELFQVAQEQREALNGKPEAKRTKADYARLMEAYRKVYRIAPSSQRADDAIVAVAELLAESGRAFEQPKSFADAIAQYEFLMREYPGTKFRVQVMFTIAEIYRQDIGDKDKAKEAYEAFLKRFPSHQLAKDAKGMLSDMEAEARAPKKPAAKPKKEEPKQARVEPPAPAPARSLPLVTGVRHWSTPDYTRVAIDLGEEVKYEAGRVPNPDRIFFDLHDTRLASELAGKTFEVGNDFLRKIRIAQFNDKLTRVVLEVDEVAEYSAFMLPNPYRLIVDIHGKQPVAQKQESTATEAAAKEPARTAAPPPQKSESARAEARRTEPATKQTENGRLADTADPQTIEIAKLKTPEVTATDKPTSAPTVETVAPRPKKLAKATVAKAPAIREARPTANGERSLIRALGLKIGRIVVDAGHGGHDTGTIGPSGLMEKDLVLDVALRLGKLLEQNLGAEVIYTRDDDTFVPLETRTALANKHQADLFISIHANSSEDPKARGVETYYLNFTSSQDALDVAARENAVSQKSIFELQDLVKKIAMKEKIEESREFASNVQRSLHRGLVTKSPGLKDRGVKKAPFIVLIGANMPSILAEVSFVSNPRDEKNMQAPAYRQRIAESLHKGIASYVGGLSGVKMAQQTGQPGAE